MIQQATPQDPHMKLLLINPNTNPATTVAMRDIAREAAPVGVVIEAATAPFGAPLIVDGEQAKTSEEAVLAMFDARPPYGVAGVIISAFADPALAILRERYAVPFTGIAEAAMAEAGAGGRRFCVVTTTPYLADAITALAARYGHGDRFLGVVLTKGDAVTTTNDAAGLPLALAAGCLRAVAELGAEAIVIGGGPLAVAARAISSKVPVPLIEPVPAAVRLAVRRAAEYAGVPA